METTTFIVQLLGPVLIAVGLSSALYTKEMLKALNEIFKSFAFRYCLGIFEMVVGVALILKHNVWTDLAAYIVSLMGWGMAIEGALWLVAPEWLIAVAKRMRNENVCIIGGVISVVIGVYFIYFGYLA